MGSTREQRNIETVMAYYARLQVSDAAGMASFLADNLQYRVYSTSPYAGQYDRDAFLGVLPVFFAKQAAPLTFDFKAVTAQEDRVCVYAWGTMPLKDGLCYNHVYQYLFRLHDDKITEIDEMSVPQPMDGEN